MINQCRAAFAAAGVFVRSKLTHADQDQSVRGVRASMWPLGVLALGVAPLGMAADLQITDLSDTGYDPAPLGSEVFYSVTLENGAGDLSANVVSIFDLPAGTVAGTLPGFCLVDGVVATRIVCTHGPLQGTLSGGTPLSFQIGVDTSAASEGTVTLRSAIGYRAAQPLAITPITSLGASHAFFVGDTNTANNVRSQATTLVTAGNLRLEKSATPDPVVGGAVVSYTLTVTNQGPSASTHFEVVDSLPDHVAYVANSFNGAGFSLDAASMTATFPGTLQPNQSATLTFDAVVNAATGNITNTAVVNAIDTPDPDTSDNIGQVITPVTPGADLTLSKVAVPAPAIAGQLIRFDLTARNLGPSPAQNVSFVDALPADFVITGGTQPPGWNCVNNPAETERTCTRTGDMAVGAAELFTIEAMVPSTGPNSSGDVTNSATITSTTPDPNGPLLGTNNNTGDVTFTVLADGADLSLAKNKSPAAVAVWDGVGPDTDSLMTSTIEVTNIGPRAATGQVQVVDQLAPGEEYVSFSGPWNCVVDGPYAAPPAQQTLTCDLDASALPLGVGQDAPPLRIVSLARAAGDLTNWACTGGSNGSLEPLTEGAVNVDPFPGNDCSGDGTRTTNERADLSITKQTNAAGTADNLVTTTDQYVEYTLQITNTGDSTPGVVVNDTIPGYVPGRTQITTPTVPAGWSCDVTAASVICESGATHLGTGETATIVLRATRPLYDTADLGSSTCGVSSISNAYCNTAGVGIDYTVDGSVGEINGDNNSASDWVQIERVANMQTAQKVITSGSPGRAGVNTTYRIDYFNDGPSTVPGVVFRDVFTIPGNDAGFVLISATRSGGGTTSCVASPGTGVTTSAAAGGSSYLNTLGTPGQVSIVCEPLDMANQQAESMTVVIRPNVDSGNTGREFNNIGDFFFDRNGDGTADPATGADGQGPFNFNTDTSSGDDSAAAVLPFASGTADLLTNKDDIGFAGGVDPMGFTADDLSQNVLTYRVTVRNNGPSLATNVRITDTLSPPAGRTVRFLGASATVGGPFLLGDCAVVAGSANPTMGVPMELDCQMPGAGFATNVPGVVAVNQTSALYLRFQYETAPGAAGDTLWNSADASANEADPNEGNNVADQDTTIRASADVRITKTMVTATPNPDPAVALPTTVSTVALHEPFYYVLTGTNFGPGSSLSLLRTGSGPLSGAGTRIVDTLPDSVLVTGLITWQKVGPTLGGDEVPNGSGTCSLAARTVTCEVGDLTVAGGDRGEVRVLIPARWDTYPSGGTSSNTAQISTEQVDPTPGNNTTTVPLTVTRSSITGVVFQDRDRTINNGGTHQGVTTEPGISGVTITLTGTDLYGNDVTRTATTTANGTYTFNNLAPSDATGYTLTQTQPGAYINGPIAPPTSGGTAPSLGGTYAAGAPNSTYTNVVVGTASTGVRYNFPEVRRPSLSGSVYVDANFNNVRDGSESGIANATVELLNAADGSVILTTTTDSDGNYSFQNLDPLITYTLRQPLPAGNYQNRPTAVTAGQIGGAACASGCVAGNNVLGDGATTDRISTIDLSSGMDGVGFNFGEDAIAGLSGSVYVDRDGDGQFGAGDGGDRYSAANGGLPDVTVTLTGAGPDGVFGTPDDPAPVVVQTGTDGAYSFTGLVVGQAYRITQTQPAGYGNGTQNPTNLISITALPAAGSTGNNFGEVLGSLAGVVFEDFSSTNANNNNGVFDAGENPIPNAALRLTGTDMLGDVVNIPVQTDATGVYRFIDLLPAQAGTTYTLTQTQPVGYLDGIHTPGNAATPGTASASNVISGINISDGQQATGYLFGELANATISGTVYLDRDDNGDQNGTEPGISGVTIVIEGAGPDGLFGTADDLPEVTLTTGADGSFSYGGGISGYNYRITETQPTGLANGGENPTNQITLTNLPAAGVTSNNFGEVAASISGNVWLDANNNGVRDAGENGIAGVSVSLPTGTVDVLGNTVAAAVTDANGDYSFDDLLANTYTVTQQEAQPVVAGVTTLNGTTVAGTITGATVGTATAVATTPSAVSSIVLPAGGESIANNFGETLGVSLAGRVFFDANNDGVQSGTDETGIEGVEITYTGVDDTGATVSGSMLTNANGEFSFTSLRPGTYTVTEPDQPAGTSNGQTVAGTVDGNSIGTATPISTTPSAVSGIDLTVPGSASIDNLFGEIPLNSSIAGRVWRDDNNDGVIDPTEPGLEGVTVRLTGTDLAGNTVTRDLVTGPDGSYEFDQLPPGTYELLQPDQPPGTLSGITVPGTGGGTGTPVTTVPSTITGITLGVNDDVTGNNFGEIPAGTISGSVYNDSNNDGVRDAGDGGFVDVEVVLTGINDLGENINLTLRTDADGRYSFDGLRPGTYMVTEPSQPPETLNGITTAGTIDGASVGTATTVDITPSAISNIVLPVGGQSIDNNFGEIGDSPDLMVSKRAVPATFTVNNIGTYVIRVRNAGQQPSSGDYVVQDRLPAGLTLAGRPEGEGWVCTGDAGETRFSCASSTEIAAGATSLHDITVRVQVSASAANDSPVTNAVIVEGGGENEFRTPSTQERGRFEGTVTDLPVCEDAIVHNACYIATPVQQAASVSGTAWFDGGSDPGSLDGADRRLSGWTVEVVDANGQVMASAITGEDGRYSIADLIPGVPLNIRFRDPDSAVVWGWPVNGERRGDEPVTCDTDAALANGTMSSCVSSEGGATSLAVVLAPGEHLPQQSLPLSPGGVIYDAVSRSPVPGSRVTLTPLGTCAGYLPEQHLLNAAQGGYSIDGESVSMTVGADGFYQFLMGPSAPASCRFQLAVTPPAGFAFVSGLIGPHSGAVTPPSTPGIGYPVQPNASAPTGPQGDATTYYLEITLGSALAATVHNHIPLDPQVAPGLVITKTGDRKTVEVGDSLLYTITVRQTAGTPMPTVNVLDRLPHGFTYIEGTARLQGAALADPLGRPGPTVVFDIGALSVGEQRTLTYRVRVGVGSQQGDGVNRARAHGCAITGGCVDPNTLTPFTGGGVIASNQAEYRVIVTGGVFTDEGCVLGKIFVDCNLNQIQDEEEIGIPGVRLYFEDGTWLVSDSEGKYSYCGLPPRSHTLKVDPSTLPRGSRLVTSSNRNLGDADSLFIDLKNGELHRADFIEGSCSNLVLEQVKARRTQGEVRAPETEVQQQPLRFESKPVRAPQQATDSANQRPIVDPRPTAASQDASGEVQP